VASERGLVQTISMLKPLRVVDVGLWDRFLGEVKITRGSRRSSRRRLERRDIEGNIPVGERLRAP
jgi:hypothetical protein